jgi:hypothetical protein
MEDLIGTTITSTVNGIAGFNLPFYLYEAEEDTYPYAVYFYTPDFFSTKDGVYKIAADVTVQVYSQDFDEAWNKAQTIETALLAGMNTAQFRTRLSTTSKECVEGIWNVEFIYNIIQIA